MKFGRLFDYPSTWATHKSFSIRGTAGGLVAHIKFWDRLFILETSRARKLQFCVLVGLYEY